MNFGLGEASIDWVSTVINCAAITLISLLLTHMRRYEHTNVFSSLKIAIRKWFFAVGTTSLGIF